MRDQDEDDSMAANPEPIDDMSRARLKRAFPTPAATAPESPHAAAGYADTLAPRSKKPKGDKAGRWEIVFREGKEPTEAVAEKRCQTCGEPPFGGVLHSIAPDIRRLHCGTCQGKSHR